MYRNSLAKREMGDIYFVGVDVGSGSVRAALVSKNGNVLKTCVKDILTWKPNVNFYEQSSSNIWNCAVHVIKDVVKNVDPAEVKGIGFDATCSLVALDCNGNPLAVNDTSDNEHNVIMWMDHRAQAQADAINKTNHEILKYVGGKVSLEMEMPKLLWLKTNLPKKWPNYGHFFDLPDFLTWKATGSYSRSLCSLVCKWNYECKLDGKMNWNVSFLNEIGLSDLAENNFAKIGNKVCMPGEACGSGLTKEVAASLGLLPGTPVGTSIIDAHAGGLGMIGVFGKNISSTMTKRLSLISGTSTCHMAVNSKPVLVQGIWGPYYSAMVPGLWLNEAGQSASGMLLDFVIANHPATSNNLLRSLTTGELRDYLRKLLSTMAANQNLPNVSMLTKDFHMWPDFHGNRSPLADPSMKGMIVGLTIDNTEENLALLYLATIQALAYGTRHILDALVTAGYEQFHALLICGGLAKDPLYVQTQADVVGLPVLKPREEDSVLIGAAILGSCASNYYRDVNEATEKMGGDADVIQPNLATHAYHDKKYQVFLRMFQDQLKYRTIMNS